MRIFVIHKPAVDADNILSLFLQRYPIGEGTLYLPTDFIDKCGVDQESRAIPKS